ncbi:MAG TPA: DNA-directed RNA polymerase [Allosphingosinicella sp.]
MALAETGRAGRKHTAAPLLLGIEPEAAAYLTLRCAIQSAVQSERLQRASLRIADAIVGHLRAIRFEEANPKGAAGLQRSLQGRQKISAKRQRAMNDIYRSSGVDVDWAQDQRLLVGTKLLELATDATGLFRLELIEEGAGRKRRKRYEVRLTEVAHDWLERQHARCELLDPLPLPMVVPPVPWRSPTEGGYLEPPVGNRFVRSENRPYLEELANADLSSVYAAVNAIQSVPWRVNHRLLQVLREAWKGGAGLGSLPPRDDAPLPSKPADLDFNEEAQARWKAAASATYAENERQRGKRLVTLQKMWVAEKLAHFPAIYFPHNIDFRGRVYPIPQAGPHPQDGDLGRSLLEFAQGVALGETGGKWLAIHLANLFGIDKVSFEDRVLWVIANEAAILDSASRPLDGERFWTTADKPWQALAACFEWAGYKAEGESFLSHLPVALDGSNSGLQHFTGLLLDEASAPYVNLVPTERPGDIYELVAGRAQSLVNALSAPEAAPWKGGRIVRSITKRPCMTYAYAATPRGMAHQIERALEELDRTHRERGEPPHLGGHENGPAAFWLARVLYGVIGDTVPAARRAMDWLQRIAKASSKAGLPLWWTSPAGLPIMQRYVQATAQRVTVTFQGRKTELALLEEAGQATLGAWIDEGSIPSMDHRAAASGIAPNFIHSMDAAHLMAVARHTQTEGLALAVIHDSFGTHAANTDRLAVILRDNFVEQYRTDWLARFREEVVEQLGQESEVCRALPQVPSRGSLDLARVREATYMFS